MTAKYDSIRQKIGEKCIFLNASIIPVPTGQKKKKMCFCLLPGMQCSGSLPVLRIPVNFCGRRGGGVHLPLLRAQDASVQRAPHLPEAEALERTGRPLCDPPCGILRVSPHLCPSQACLGWALRYAPACQCLSAAFSLSTWAKAGLLGLPASTGLQKDLS